MKIYIILGIGGLFMTFLVSIYIFKYNSQSSSTTLVYPTSSLSPKNDISPTPTINNESEYSPTYSVYNNSEFVNDSKNTGYSNNMTKQLL